MVWLPRANRFLIKRRCSTRTSHPKLAFTIETDRKSSGQSQHQREQRLKLQRWPRQRQANAKKKQLTGSSPRNRSDSFQGHMKAALRAGIFVAAILPGLSFGGARHFGFIYEAPTSAPGSFELENWVTWARTTNPEHSDQVAFRHEIEIGVTDRLQASIYLADWFYENAPGHSGSTYSDSAIELIYNLTNPVIDPIGLSLYQEYKVGDRLFEWESKLIAQKNLGPLILAYNATLEAVWEGQGLAEREGEFQQALGASYEISPRISVGLEFLHEFVFPDWHDTERIRNVFIGPNVSYRYRSWFVTVTALAQPTNTPDEPGFQLRTIFGFGF